MWCKLIERGCNEKDKIDSYSEKICLSLLDWLDKKTMQINDKGH